MRPAATAAAQTVSPGKGASGSFAIGSRGGPRSPTPPTSPAVPRTPSLCLPPSPASSRRTQPPPSPSYASARPLPPTSPSVSPRRASPVSSPCDSPSSSFSFAVPRATSHEYRAAVAATINGVSGSGGGGGGIGGSKSGQQGKLLRSVSSQWDSSSRSLRAGRNLAGSSPNRMLSVNVHLQAAIACVATDSASVAADSSSAAAESPCVAEASPSAPPAAARSATAGGILRRGGLKRMPSLDTMSSPAYATSPPSPASSPLTRAAAAAGGAGGAASSTASAGVNDTAYTTAAAAISASSAAHHSRGLSLGDSPPTPSLGESPITTPQLSPGPSPGRGHVRRVSFCSMVRVRRFSACDADLGPAADAAITAFEEAEAAAAAARAAAAAATKAAAAEAAAEAAREADAKARVHPASTVSRHPMHRGSRSLIERPHHSQSPPYFGANQTNPGQRVAGTSESLIECSHRHSRSPSYSGVFPLSPDLSGPSQAIRRTSSFQHSGPGSPARYSRSHGYSAAAAAAPRGSEERRGGSRSRTHTPGIEISGVSEEHGEPQLAIPNLTPGSNEHQLGIRTPVPPKMPSPRLAPSPRVQRLLQHMWGDVGDGNEAA
ncbi:hypothetical protein CLOP_g20411 [Closterium sp. NIES-67]|nr:hypothetical protein CLOP_g20411 [Closterium sp. NIES-67]